MLVAALRRGTTCTETENTRTPVAIQRINANSLRRGGAPWIALATSLAESFQNARTCARCRLTVQTETASGASGQVPVAQGLQAVTERPVLVHACPLTNTIRKHASVHANGM